MLFNRWPLERVPRWSFSIPLNQPRKDALVFPMATGHLRDRPDFPQTSQETATLRLSDRPGAQKSDTTPQNAWRGLEELDGRDPCRVVPKPWNDDSAANTNKQWCSVVSKWSGFRPSIVWRFYTFCLFKGHTLARNLESVVNQNRTSKKYS